MSALLHVDDHAEQAVEKTAQQLRGKPLFEALTRLLVRQLQNAENAVWMMYLQRRLATAAGAELDLFGRIVGQPRNAYADAQYRRQISARVLFNASSGTREDVLAIFRQIVPGTTTLTMREMSPASFRLIILGDASVVEDLPLYRTFTAAKVAGVGGEFVYSLSSNANTFRLDVGPGLDVGHIAGDL